jgi:N-acetylmuramoyl-L-alanine amidase
VVEKKTSEAVAFNTGWEFGSNSKINSGSATLYYATGSNKKGRTVCVNAGHGTKGGESVKTLCHPDGTAKVTGGSTAAGNTHATAVSSGTTMSDGTSEAYVNLKVAKALKNVLLERGYNVLMIRESEDVQLDNIARTVMANNRSDCHIAIHYDSTTKNKGAFFMSVADGIKGMYPVSTIWQESDRLGANVINGLSANGVKIFGDGSMQMDLTQTSYSKIPSIDLELGDKVSDYSDSTVAVLAKGIADGIDSFYS